MFKAEYEEKRTDNMKLQKRMIEHRTQNKNIEK